MPSHEFHPGDECSCYVHVCNTTGTTLSWYPLFVILDVYGMYFFAPTFSEFDYYMEDVAPGMMTIDVLPSFQWPSGVGSASGIVWYAAMTNAEITDLFGDLGTFTFGWH